MRKYEVIISATITAIIFILVSWYVEDGMKIDIVYGHSVGDIKAVSGGITIIIVLPMLIIWELIKVLVKKRKLSDEDAQQVIYRYSGCSNIAEFQKLDINTRDKYLKKFIEKGLTLKQISRLTGINRKLLRHLKR